MLALMGLVFLPHALCLLKWRIFIKFTETTISKALYGIAVANRLRGTSD
jgi:hypothetical protein